MPDAQRSTPLRDNVKVFGSSVVRVTPDAASIVVAVTRVEKETKDAFAIARRAAQKVHACLQQAGITEFGASRVSLSQEYRLENGTRKLVGHLARIGYCVLIRDLDRIEELLIAIIGAGANELTSITFRTSRLKEVRAEARRRAIAAAREKAELYCKAAGVAVGRVLAIEDVNPNVVTGHQESSDRSDPGEDDSGELRAIEPGAICVGAAVVVVYSIE